MGKRLKILIATLSVILLYALYYWGLPVLINAEKVSPYIASYIKNEYKFDVRFKKPNFKMGLTPSIWLWAEEFKIVNDDGSSALSVENPRVEVSLFPLIIGKLNIKYFSSNNLFVDISCDKSFRTYLGQYLLIRTSDFIINANRSKILVDDFVIKLNDFNKNETIYINGDYFNVYKFVKNKCLSASLLAKINSKSGVSDVNINIDSKLPVNMHLDSSPPEISAAITNLNLADFSNFIKYFTNNSVRNIAGDINLEIHSDKKIVDQKQYFLNFVINNLFVDADILQKPYYYGKRIKINGNLLTQKHELNIPSFVFSTPTFETKLSGSIDKINTKKPIPHLNLKMINARSENLLEIIPYCRKFEDLINLYPSYAKDAGFYSNVKVDLNIADSFEQPNMYGSINISDAYVFDRIKKAPKGADINIKFFGNYMDLDVLVPTDIAQNVTVTGKIESYGAKNVDLHIKSTPMIDLYVAKRVLMPVHRTLNFLLGPVPVMEFSGFGNIDLVVKGNRDDAHTYGVFKTIGASTEFDDIKNLVLKNADAELSFENKITRFQLKKGTINGKPVSIDGTCDLTGHLNFDVKALGQNINDLLLVLKTSPMLSELKDSVAEIESVNGNGDFILNLKGHLPDIEDIVLGKNINAAGKITLRSVSAKLSELKFPVKNLSGDIKFNNTDLNVNLESKITNDKIFLSGDIKNDIANVSFNSQDIKLSELIKTVNLPDLHAAPGDSDGSILKFNGSYSGKVSKFQPEKLNLTSTINFKKSNLFYGKNRIPIYIPNGSAIVKDNVLSLNKLNAQIATMPVILDGKIRNIFAEPDLNLFVSAKPNQKFAYYVFNKSAIYPIKMKGDISTSILLSGFFNKLDIKSNIRLGINSSVYYMGASLGDPINPIVISLNALAEKNLLHIRSLDYSKQISYSYNRKIQSKLLNMSGSLNFARNNVIFKNLKITTNEPTDMKIFNVIFKKPLIKNGLFTSNILINGSLNKPLIRGKFYISSVDIPFFDASIKQIHLNFLNDTVVAKVNGDLLSNNFTIDLTALNKLTPPFVIKNAKLNLASLNLNRVLETLNDYSSDFSEEQIQRTSNTFDINSLIVEHFDIRAGEILFNNINARNLKTNISLANSLFKINQFNFNLAQGEMEGSVAYNVRSKKSDFDLKVIGADANKLLSSLLDVKGQLYGDLDGQLNFSCTGESQADCLKTLNGYAAFRINNGRMPKLGSLEYLLKAGNLLKGGLTGLSINGLIDLVTPLKTGEFQSIKGSITAKNGIADNIQIVSTGKDLNIYATGNYNFSNYNADMYVYGRLSKKISNLLGPIGNISLNTLFNTIPEINKSSKENASVLKYVNKIPGIEFSNDEFRVFAAEIHGDISGDDYVESFRWVN